MSITSDDSLLATGDGTVLTVHAENKPVSCATWGSWLRVPVWIITNGYIQLPKQTKPVILSVLPNKLTGNVVETISLAKVAQLYSFNFQPHSPVNFLVCTRKSLKYTGLVWFDRWISFDRWINYFGGRRPSFDIRVGSAILLCKTKIPLLKKRERLREVRCFFTARKYFLRIKYL